jgi:hypothetical protein
MSSLENLRAQIDALALQSERMAANLEAFRSPFANAVAEVQSTIGGSAQRKDRELIERVSAAQRDVQTASAALQQAARTARDYGASL